MTGTTTQPTAAPPAELLDARSAAALLSVSPRHLYRMADSGRCPPPIRLGNCVRWHRGELLQWLADGCPPVDRRAGR